ncbi:hypothetical protein VINI7043_27130 [Vibrio nigripulchritudo ATCC 27043]|uniref:methyltransferase n=1 Tax=Vibrio nigripulchritudo TaxID=28173 RepID=UPI00021C3BAA|nr:methyltransferase [Vibrio nigripulchritudo]EGU55879.1 hypothetical protein VINI7043_27130 [Vibrio nigripulchritudo ATCC 27043]
MNHTFLDITSILKRYDSLWRIQPFHLSLQSEYPWDSSHPELNTWLLDLTEDEIIELKSDPDELIRRISETLPDALRLKELTSLPSRGLSHIVLSKGAETGIPGKKLSQILSMGEACIESHHGSEWLEWCSGKGFLGQVLSSKSQEHVTSFEWQHSLCESGQTLADKKKLPMTFIQGDALSDSSKAIFKPEMHAVALHACGDLHISLIRHGSDANLSAFSIAPCCYHLIQAEHYTPLSSEGKRLDLSLSRSELRIPLQATVTGGERVHKHRREEMIFRLGLDSYLRQKQQSDYTPIPSIKKSMLSEGFQHFCHWAAEKKELNLGDMDFEYWQEIGEQRFWIMERLSLVQQIFQRPLELWLILDRALYLQEKGYEVTLCEFCERNDTPRNILIQAKKRPA